MATPSNTIVLSLETTNLLALQEELERLFNRPALAKVMEAAIKKAIAPVTARLKQVAPLGPTGNLRSAVDSKMKTYLSSGVAVGLVGFRRAGRDASESAAGGTVRKGRDRAFHQWFLEQGTKGSTITKIANKPYGRRGHLRRIPGRPAVEVRPHVVKKGQNAVIASSFGRLGPFKFLPSRQRVQTDPPYPGAFFRKARKGESLLMPAQAPGGRDGRPPLATAWAETGTVAAEIMQRELQAAIVEALNGLDRLGDRDAA